MRRVVIRGTMVGGYLVRAVVISALIGAVLGIWFYPAESARWLTAVGLPCIGAFLFEAISRRTFVEVEGERIRWFFREPRSQGDESVGSLRSVTLDPAAGALLEFAGGTGLVMVRIDDFRTRDIIRLVEALRGLGVQIDDSRGPMYSLIEILLGRRIRH